MKPFALLLALVMCSPAWADDASDLIKQLDADKFQDREEAGKKLQALGKDAIPALAKAAEEGPLESVVRAIDILKNLTESNDKETVTTATEALEKLAKSENAGTARRAKSALTPKPKPAPAAPRFAPAGARIVIQKNAQRVNMKNVNGVKTIEATDNQREIKIVDDPNKGITVEITEPKNGKKTTEKFEAKNEAELKKKHPKAHAEYEKYAKNNGANGIRIQLNGRAVPFAPVLPIRPAIPAMKRANGTRLEMAGRLLKSVLRHIETVANDQTIGDADNKARESLKKDITDLKKQLTELENKLQKAIDAETKKPEEKKPEDKK